MGGCIIVFHVIARVMAIQHFIASSSRPTPIFYLLPTLITFFKSMSFPSSLVVISFPFIIFTFWWLFDVSEMTSSRLKPWNQTKQYFWGLVLNVFLYAISPHSSSWCKFQDDSPGLARKVGAPIYVFVFLCWFVHHIGGDISLLAILRPGHVIAFIQEKWN